MSFRRFVEENRGRFIDHRSAPPGPGLSIEDDPLGSEAFWSGASVDGAGTGRNRRRRREQAAGRSRGGGFRQVRPAFTPSPWTEPLPYEDPLERVFR